MQASSKTPARANEISRPSVPSPESVQTAGALKASLGLREDAVHGGGDVRFADASALQSPAGSSRDNTKRTQQGRRAGTVSLYVVREADSLGEIAAMFDVSVNTIIWANDIKNRTIHPGETLVILPMTGVRHIVKEGDTLASIAETYGADIDEMRDFNDLDEDDELAAGDVVDIPDGEKGTAISTSERVASTPTHSTGSSWLITPVHGIKTQHIHGYNAVDFGAPVGTNVVASAGGRVIVAKSGGWNGGYGSYVIIEHANGAQTLYAHLNSVLAGVGAQVVQGEIIGYSGNTGRSTGPHLHFEVRGATNPF